MSTTVLGTKSFSNVPTVSGNPLMINAGGTPSVQSGLESAIPAAGSVGRLYLTTDTNLIYRDTGTVWVILSPASNTVVNQVFTGAIPATTGTTIISLNNTTPLITSGTQIWSQTITPSSTSSIIDIKFSIYVDSGTSNRVSTVALFRNSTCIGVQCASVMTTARGQNLTMIVDDLPTTTSPVTYSARIGTSSSATWYVNRGTANLFNGLIASNGYTIMEYV